MTSPADILDPSTPVLIISESNSNRMAVSSSMGSLSYNNLVKLSSVKEAVSYLSENRGDWIFIFLEKEAQPNLFYLLEYLKRSAQPRFISLFLNPADYGLLPWAFADGLTSYHQPETTPLALNQVLTDLLNTWKAEEKNLARISAVYLRTCLEEIGQYEMLVQMERGLIRNNPGRPDLLTGLARACFLNGNPEEAEAALNQAVFLDKSLIRPAEQVRAAQGSGGRNAVAKDGGGLAVIIEPDGAVANQVESLLQEMQFETMSFEDSLLAWEWLDAHDEPSLIIHEWRLPGLSGIQLIQRIRNKGFRNVPLIVISSRIKKDEAPLLSEMSVDNIISKPITQDDFMLTVRWTVNQSNAPTEQKSQEQKIIALLEQKKTNQARTIHDRYLADPRLLPGRRSMIAAFFLYHDGRFDEARQELSRAMVDGGADSLISVNLLGRCLLKMGKPELAVRCFEKASVLSPHNMERLCMLADLQTANNDLERAKESIDTATKLDRFNERLQSTRVGYELAKNNLEEAQRLMQEMGNPRQIIISLNNSAIAMSKSGRIPQAISLYGRALQALPSKAKDLRCIIAYNSALANAREGDLDALIHNLRLAIEEEESPVNARARSLLKRARLARKQGVSLKLKVQEFSLKEGGSVGKSEINYHQADSDDPVVTLRNNQSDASNAVDFKDGALTWSRPESGEPDRGVPLAFNPGEVTDALARRMKEANPPLRSPTPKEKAS